MAASNAAFWTGRDSKGDLPGFHYEKHALTMALPTIFSPLIVFGLFRLPAALWLTNEYGYADVDS
ncbi:hypothetical protein V2W45_1342781 [Cenococcum geophilum]